MWFLMIFFYLFICVTVSRLIAELLLHRARVKLEFSISQYNMFAASCCLSYPEASWEKCWQLSSSPHWMLKTTQWKSYVINRKGYDLDRIIQLMYTVVRSLVTALLCWLRQCEIGQMGWTRIKSNQFAEKLGQTKYFGSGTSKVAMHDQFYWDNIIDINSLIKDFCINTAHTWSITLYNVEKLTIK